MAAARGIGGFRKNPFILACFQVCVEKRGLLDGLPIG
jgi:hypothetical protein